MNRHALEVLEFPRALGLVAEKAASPLGRAAVLERTPVADVEDLRRELARVGAVMDFLSEKPSWGPPPIPDARGAVRRLAVDGSVLEPLELHALGVLLTSGRALRREMERRDPETIRELASIRDRLHVDEEAREAVERTVDGEGEVLDTASGALRSIRSKLRRAHSRIVQKLEAFIGSLPDRYVVADASVTIRDGRYVIPVRREGKSEVGGIIHDESATGATLFVEPPVAISLMNELRALEREEAREIRKILGEMTARFAPDRDALAGSQDALVDFDSLHARARAGRAWEGSVPELLAPGSGPLRVVRGRHPLLLVSEEEVVPFDLELLDDELCLVVSGPNTGGKSVFLKALGLTVALTQTGCVPPVADGTALPVFSDLFADIGDEQSIAESLSTFSAHLENLREIVEEADARSLVLIDEMGTGTDPAEGAALARAILETLVSRGARAVVTSHLGALKALDTEGSGIVNASLQFDPDRMAPTYRFVKGRPGRSYGLAIARRLGFPPEVLDRAESHVSSGDASVEDLLERLERKDRDARELVDSLEQEQAEAARLRKELQEREKQLRERERTAERRARDEARELLMDAREEVEKSIREVRAARDEEALQEASHQARHRVEEAARRQVRRRPDDPDREGPAPDLEVGQSVKVEGTGTRGRVVEVKDGRVVVEASGLRMELPVVDVTPVADGGGSGGAGVARPSPEGAAQGEASGRSGTASVSAGGGWSGTMTEAAAHEVDLRGLRVDEVELELGRALDAAALAGLHEIRIIHGKGTGAVRSRVQELLRRDGRVPDFRLGQRGEGGSGVTVAKVE